MDARKLERLMGFAPGELEKTADSYESDDWPAGRTAVRGYSPLADDPSALLPHRAGEPAAAVRACAPDRARKPPRAG